MIPEGFMSPVEARHCQWGMRTIMVIMGSVFIYVLHGDGGAWFSVVTTGMLFEFFVWDTHSLTGEQ